MLISSSWLATPPGSSSLYCMLKNRMEHWEAIIASLTSALLEKRGIEEKYIEIVSSLQFSVIIALAIITLYNIMLFSPLLPCCHFIA